MMRILLTLIRTASMNVVIGKRTICEAREELERQIIIVKRGMLK